MDDAPDNRRSDRPPRDSFWSRYEAAHRSALNCWLHALGTVASLAVLLGVILSHEWWWLLAVPIVGYLPAWIGHALFEHNRPLSFEAPWKSLLADYRLTFLLLTGQYRTTSAAQTTEPDRPRDGPPTSISEISPLEKTAVES